MLTVVFPAALLQRSFLVSVAQDMLQRHSTASLAEHSTAFSHQDQVAIRLPGANRKLPAAHGSSAVAGVVCRNEQGKRKHPEFSGLPVCRECFDLLGAAAWHLEGDWKDEGGSDKYCRFCASSAPGGTSTLMHCGKPGCCKGFCTGYAAQVAMLCLSATTSESNRRLRRCLPKRSKSKDTFWLQH